jgi:uncharacterized protein (DUF1800 family)
MGDAAHLLRRAGFGVTPPMLGELMALPSRAAAVDRMLDAGRAPSAAVEPVPPLELLDTATGYSLMTQWWMDRMRTSPVPLIEKLTLFWHGHFVSGADKVTDFSLMMRQNQLFRSHALGSYYDLAQSVAVDPAMLLYLDNFANVKDGPQENFARELMELFTIGVRNVTEPDVIAMARAWTGHGLDGFQHSYEFHPAQHDTGSFSLFGSKPRPWNGPDALRAILVGPKAVEASRFIAAKLFSFLAFPVTPDDPFVQLLADRFRAQRLQLRPLVRDILLSDAFWSAGARGALVRSPIEWAVAAMQGVDVAAGAVQPEAYMLQMGQAPFRPPNVAGWKQNAYWLSTSANWGKAAFALRLRQEVAEATGGAVDSRAPRTVVSEGFTRYGIVAPSPTTRSALEGWVARAQKEGDGSQVAPNLALLLILSPDFQIA